jgi:sensor histidine kinase regulating citrate/malate metabolism
MQLGLRAKLTLIMTALVLFTAVAVSLIFLEQLLQRVLLETDLRANDLAREVFDSAGHALEDAKVKGFLPASNEAEDTHDYVRMAF